MREAIKKTLALHQMVVDGEYKDYETAKHNENNGECYLCLADDDGCDECPWIVIDDEVCHAYKNSEKSIIRLNRWLADPRMETS